MCGRSEGWVWGELAEKRERESGRGCSSAAPAPAESQTRARKQPLREPGLPGDRRARGGKFPHVVFLSLWVKPTARSRRIRPRAAAASPSFEAVRARFPAGKESSAPAPPAPARGSHAWTAPSSENATHNLKTWGKCERREKAGAELPRGRGG